jgi:peroxiredoxin
MNAPEVPETLEGWYVQHEVYAVNWSQWRALDALEREPLLEESMTRLTRIATPEEGSTALFSVLGHKGDLLVVHFRSCLEALNTAKLGLRQLRLFRYLQPVYSYLSVIELGLYEVAAAVHRQLEARGLEAGSPAYEEAYRHEIAQQKEGMRDRLYPAIPARQYVCFYPMNKKRGEVHNWYALPMQKRRELMRGHGMVGRKYAGKVNQVISGSVGFDDWEWGVSLFADDPLVFKKLVYEMRFDPASALYGEFGPFYVGIRREPKDLDALLAGPQSA